MNIKKMLNAARHFEKDNKGKFHHLQDIVGPMYKASQEVPGLAIESSIYRRGMSNDVAICVISTDIIKYEVGQRHQSPINIKQHLASFGNEKNIGNSVEIDYCSSATHVDANFAIKIAEDGQPTAGKLFLRMTILENKIAPALERFYALIPNFVKEKRHLSLIEPAIDMAQYSAFLKLTYDKRERDVEPQVNTLLEYSDNTYYRTGKVFITTKAGYGKGRGNILEYISNLQGTETTDTQYRAEISYFGDLEDHVKDIEDKDKKRAAALRYFIENHLDIKVKQ
jgi:hypothetical protein